MEVKNYLFVCRHNFTRSKYGAEFFRGFLEGRNKKGNVYSAGIGFISNFLGKRVNKKVLMKSNIIFVMEKYMKDYIVSKFNVDKNKIIILNIKDEYGFLKRKSFDDLGDVFESKHFERYL